MTPFQNDKVKIKFDSYPNDIKPKLLELRELIFDVAKEEKKSKSILYVF